MYLYTGCPSLSCATGPGTTVSTGFWSLFSFWAPPRRDVADSGNLLRILLCVRAPQRLMPYVFMMLFTWRSTTLYITHTLYTSAFAALVCFSLRHQRASGKHVATNLQRTMRRRALIPQLWNNWGSSNYFSLAVGSGQSNIVLMSFHDLKLQISADSQLKGCCFLCCRLQSKVYLSLSHLQQTGAKWPRSEVLDISRHCHSNCTVGLSGEAALPFVSQLPTTILT